MDNDTDAYIIRDTDSRLSFRERSAVDEWIDSDKDFHILRDHPGHVDMPMLAGLWGGKRRIPEMLGLINYWNNRAAFGDDQRFLEKMILPLIINDTLQHDSFSCTRYGGIGFPSRRASTEHVGQVFDENDIPRSIEINTIKNKLPGIYQN
jgi:hypothetical protein